MKKNLKKALCVLMSTGMLFSGVTVAYGEESNISLQINGSEISAEVPPTVIDGRTIGGTSITVGGTSADISLPLICRSATYCYRW